MENCETCGNFKNEVCVLDAPKCKWIPKDAPDNVNHPAHYEQSCSLECIQVMELVFGAEAVKQFCMCNAFKYMWRYKNKGGLEDLKKAQWYLNYASGYEYIVSGDDKCEFMENLLEELMEKMKDGHQV